MSDTLLQNAQSAFQARKFDEASRIYHELLRDNPRHFEALYGLGLVYLHGNEFEKSQYLVGEAIKLDPLFADGMCVRGVALVRLKRHDEALACFEQALALRPDFADALVNHATTLLELGRHSEALSELNRALSTEPKHAVGWNSRGNVLAAMRRYREAVESYDRALAIYPDFPDARQNRLYALGELTRGSPGFAEVLCAQATGLMERKNWAEALACFNEALSAKPDLLEAHAGRATALLEMDRPDDALAGFDAALRINAGHAISWNNRGNALAIMRRFEEALGSYDKALAIQSNLPQAAVNRENVLFMLQRTGRCPPGYMSRLFDDFASHYDDTMVNALSYRAHLHLRDLAERVLPRLTPPWRILDLGCGTGLVGEAFKDLAVGGRLDGIDLAPRMIEASRARGIYDDLILGDLETVLANPGPSYDLILAADTMIYLGDLSTCFAGVAKRLEPGGFYLFAVESSDANGWQQTPMNRFRHSEAYLRSEAANAGLEFVELTQCTLRHESNWPVDGFAVALRRPAANSISL